jgi:hypothetical protein
MGHAWWAVWFQEEQELEGKQDTITHTQLFREDLPACFD